MLYFLPNGKELELRPAVTGDEPGLLAFFEQLSSETDFLSFYPDEAAGFVPGFVDTYIGDTHSQSPPHLLLLALIDAQIIGLVAIRQQSFYKNAHVGVLAIGVLHSCWNLGIGRKMMTAACRWAEQHDTLEIIDLRTNSNNEKAIQLYRNFDFHEYGRFPASVRLKDGSYLDTVFMAKKLKG
jgi:RimJ/RimL family protein N-acetyltransferase